MINYQSPSSLSYTPPKKDSSFGFGLNIPSTPESTQTSSQIGFTKAPTSNALPAQTIGNTPAVGTKLPVGGATSSPSVALNSLNAEPSLTGDALMAKLREINPGGTYASQQAQLNPQTQNQVKGTSTTNPNLTVVNTVDNPDGTTTEYYNDGTSGKVTYTQNADGSLTPQEVTEPPFSLSSEDMQRQIMPQNEQPKSQTQLLKERLFSMLGIKDQKSQEYNQQLAQSGYQEKQAQYSNLASQVQQLQKEDQLAQLQTKQRMDELTGQGRGIPMSIISGQQQEVQKQAARESLNRAAQGLVISSSMDALKGDMAASDAKIKQALDLKYGQTDADYENFMNTFQVLYPLLSEEEKAKAEAVAAEKQAQQAEAKDTQAMLNDAIKFARDNGAVDIQSALMQLDPRDPEIRNKASLITSGVKIDNLDKTLKQLQIQKAQQDLAGGGLGAGKMLTPTEAMTLGVPYGTTDLQAANMGINVQNVEAMKNTRNTFSSIEGILAKYTDANGQPVTPSTFDKSIASKMSEADSLALAGAAAMMENPDLIKANPKYAEMTIAGDIPGLSSIASLGRQLVGGNQYPASKIVDVVNKAIALKDQRLGTQTQLAGSAGSVPFTNTAYASEQPKVLQTGYSGSTSSGIKFTIEK